MNWRSLFICLPIKYSCIKPVLSVRWLKNLRKLSRGVECYTYRADLDNVDNVFVIKEPRTDKTGLIHEYFIGRHMNKLRQFIPNFAYIYAAFTCSPVTQTEGPEIKQWCTGNVDPV